MWKRIAIQHRHATPEESPAMVEWHAMILSIEHNIIIMPRDAPIKLPANMRKEKKQQHDAVVDSTCGNMPANGIPK